MPEKFFDNLIKKGLLVLVFLMPLFFLPLTSDFYDFNKNSLLFVVCLLLSVFWTAKMLISKKVSFRTSSFDLPVLLLTAVFLASTIFVSPNKITDLLTPGSTGTFLIMALFYFLTSNHFDKDEITSGIKSLLLSSSLVSLVTLLWFLDFGQVLGTNLPAWLTMKTFSPAGGLLAAATFLGVVLVLSIKPLKAGAADLLFYSSTILLTGMGLTAALYQFLTTAPPILLPFSAAWAISLESVKVSPFLGVGPSSFLTAFNRFRPVFLNTGNLWSLKFASSSNWYFQLLTTTGFFGLAAFVFLIAKIVKIVKRAKLDNLLFALIFGLAAVLTSFLLLPANFLLLFVFYFLLGSLSAVSREKEFQESSTLLPWLIFLPVAAITGLAFYFGGRNFLGEFYYKKALDAFAQNKGGQTYNLQIQAIAMAPQNEAFRLTYSQTSLALANSLAGNPQAGGLTDQDRQNISILIQQAINEAKAAVSLNPQDSNAWENLAVIYHQLINFVQGADTWTIASYQQAIILDPTNPVLRLSLGGVYYNLQKWDEAQRLFEQTVNLKPDYANGYYNLSAALREKGDLTKAVSAMETTLSLVSPLSDDWAKANNELEALKKPAPTVTPAPEAETLSLPQPPVEGLKPPLALPTSSGPENIPTPTVTLAPSL